MMICAECLMQRRIASYEKDGTEPSWDIRPDDGLPPVVQAATVINGVALCAGHLVQCVQVQRQSALVGANGAPILIDPGR